MFPGAIESPTVSVGQETELAAALPERARSASATALFSSEISSRLRPVARCSRDGPVPPLQYLCVLAGGTGWRPTMATQPGP